MAMRPCPLSRSCWAGQLKRKLGRLRPCSTCSNVCQRQCVVMLLLLGTSGAQDISDYFQNSAYCLFHCCILDFKTIILFLLSYLFAVLVYCCIFKKITTRLLTITFFGLFICLIIIVLITIIILVVNNNNI